MFCKATLGMISERNCVNRRTTEKLCSLCFYTVLQDSLIGVNIMDNHFVYNTKEAHFGLNNVCLS